MELEEILQKEKRNEEYIFFIKRKELVCLRAFCLLLLFSSGDVRCGLVDVYHRDV